jgi:hypothetical protein
METLTLGAASPASCVCSAGYYLHNSVCVPVMEGVNATAVGQTLPTLQLLPGYWRTGPNSPDVSPCRVKGSCLGTSPAFIAAVAAGEGPDADTPVVGGLTFSDSVCMPLATGPMCELCEKPLAVQNGVCVLCMSDDFIILTPAGNCLLAALFLFGVLQILRNRPTLFSRRFRGPKTYASSSMSAVTPNGTGPGGPETELAAGGGAKQAELAGRAGQEEVLVHHHHTHYDHQPHRPALKTKIKLVISFCQLLAVIVHSYVRGADGVRCRGMA